MSEADAVSTSQAGANETKTSSPDISDQNVPAAATSESSKTVTDSETKEQAPFTSSKVGEYDALVTWVTERLGLMGLEGEEKSDRDMSGAIVDFITGEGPKVMTVVAGEETISLHNEFREDMQAYMLRPNRQVLTRDNIGNLVQYGSVGGKEPISIVVLERMMKGLVDKQVSANTSLTDGARNELCAHYHRCMATLTDTIHVDDGKTVLYCPDFDAGQSVSVAAKNKDLVQIIESIVIHWTRQIKDVVNNAENSNTEISGPLDEIDFWKGRARDLLGIQEQIQVKPNPNPNPNPDPDPDPNLNSGT